MNYPIAAFLIQIKNAYMARKKVVVFPHSKTIEAIGKILANEGFVKKSEVKTEGARKFVEATLLFKNHEPAMTDVAIISKPSIHRYAGKDELKRRVSKFKVSIVSTNQGIMTAREAAEKNIGGELICTVN